MLVAGPRSGSFHEDKAHAICLAGVTSNTWTVPGQCDGLSSPAIQQHRTVLPLASRSEAIQIGHWPGTRRLRQQRPCDPSMEHSVLDLMSRLGCVVRKHCQDARTRESHGIVVDFVEQPSSRTGRVDSFFIAVFSPRPRVVSGFGALLICVASAALSLYPALLIPIPPA